MMWEKVKLGNVCEITSSKRIFYSEYVDDGVPFYRSKEIIESDEGKVIENPLYISVDKYNEIKEKFGVPQTGDMLLTSVGTIGIPYIIKKKDCFYFKDGNLTWFRDFREGLNSKYLYYWIKSSEGTGILYNTTIGSSQRALTISALKNIKVSLPPRSVQDKIVEVVSAYDDLIENNQKQIKLLEEAAQRLYKEWFVDLRFPGHENTKIVDGVPEGWSRTNINEILTFHRGYDLTKNEMKAGRYPVVGSTTVIGYHNEFKIKGPGIVTGRSGSLGKYQFIWDNFWPHNTSLYISDYKDHNIFFVYSLLQTVDFASLNNGGAIPTLNRNVLSNIEVIEPTDELQEMFAKIAEPQYQKIKNLEKQNNQLKMARDALLPKLMSGEVEV